MARVSLDTNILVYAADPSADDRHDIARTVLIRAGAGSGALSQQVIGEFLNVSRRSAHLNQQQLRRIAAGLCTVFPIMTTSRELLFEAFDLSARHVLQFWDAVIIAVCGANDIAALLTEDLQDGQIIGGVSIINPFRPANDARIRDLLSA